MLTRITFISLILMLTACESVKLPRIVHVNSPKTVVQSVEITDQSSEGARFVITVKLTNPNDVALPLVDAQYVLAVADHVGVPFRANPNRTLPAKGSQIVELAAAIAFTKTDLTAAKYAVTGSVTYNPPGEIRELLTESKVPLPSASFSATGQFE